MNEDEIDRQKARLQRAVAPIVPWRTVAEGLVSCDPVEQGTAFFITNSGVFLSARHVMVDKDQKDNAPHMSVLVVNHENSTFRVCPVLHVIQHPVLDVAIG